MQKIAKPPAGGVVRQQNAPELETCTVADDTRNLSQLIRQFQLLEGVKSRLNRMGAISGDATNEQLIAALRAVVPADLFPQKKPPATPAA